MSALDHIVSTTEQIDSATLLPTFRHARDIINQFIGETPSHGRLDEIGRTLEMKTEKDSVQLITRYKGAPDALRMLFRAAYEAKEIISIAESLVLFEDSPRLRQLLIDLHHDHHLPSSPNQSSRGRAAQLELYFASRFASGGAKVRFGDPTEEEADLIIDGASQRFAVEVKRLQSGKKFEDRVAEASDLLSRSHCPGAIALDITVASNTVERTPLISEAGLGQAIDEYLESQLRTILPWTHRKVCPRRVHAMILRFMANAFLETRHLCTTEVLWMEALFDLPECKRTTQILRTLLYGQAKRPCS